MTNNDVLRRLRYTFNFNDEKMIAMFAQGELKADRAQISNWLKKDDDAEFKPCLDLDMARFLNGLINDKRGKKEGAQPQPETKLDNNIIFRKLKIAFNLKDIDILEMLSSAGMTISRHELSAFFRKKGHKHYRECQDQVLRNFLNGVQTKFATGVTIHE